MSWSVEGKPIPSILISRLRYLGDVIMSTVVLEVLRKGDPAIDIGYLCESAHGSVLQNHPHLNRLHLLGAGRTSKNAQARSHDQSLSGRGTLGTFLGLKKQKYSIAVDLFFNPRSAWLLRFSGSTTRICGDAGSRRKLFTHSVLRNDFSPEKESRHDETLNRIAPGGLGEHLCRLAPLRHDPTGLDFLDWLNQNYTQGSLKPEIASGTISLPGEDALVRQGVNLTEPYIVAAPVATWESKMMPIPLWKEALDQLAEATGIRVLILTAPGKFELLEPLNNLALKYPVTVLEPMMLPDVLGIIQGGSALLSVDGGIMHAGVGLGVPTVGLFGPTDPAMWFPYEGLGPFRVLTTNPDCSPCHLHHCNNFICMPQLKAEVMVKTIQSVMQANVH